MTHRGITIIELLVAAALVSVLAAASVAALARFNATKALEQDAARVVSLLERARTLAVASKNASAFGVHFDTDRAVLFEGISYTAGAASNKTERFHREVVLAGTELAGGGNDVIFSKLSGATGQSGTVTLALAADTSITTVITVEATGVAYSD